MVAVAMGMLAALPLGSCVDDRVILSDDEGLLAASGFQAWLTSPPLGQIVPQPAGEGFTYVFAHPTLCGCVFTGDAAAYGRYRQAVF